MLTFLLRIVVALLAFRLVSRLLRGGSRSRVGKRPGRAGPRPFPQDDDGRGARSPDYSDITPWDVEDADYEDLPGGKP